MGWQQRGRQWRAWGRERAQAGARRLGPWLRGVGLRARGGERRLRAFGRLGAGRRLGMGPDGHLDGATLRQALARLARPFGLRGWRAGVAVATSALGLLLLVSLVVSGRGAPRLFPGTAQRPQIIGFYQNGWSAIYKSSFPSVQAHQGQISTVLAFWYSVDGSGTLHSHSPKPQVTTWIRDHHMRMGVLINNVPGPSGNNAGMLTNPTARSAAVRHIAAMVHSAGYQEVNIDFELLKPQDRSGLTSFMRDLRAALPKSVVLSESVFPKIGVPSSINGAYDYAALAKVVDYLVIMLYDNHYNGGPAGPVSPYSWVVANLNWFLHTDHIPAHQLVLAAGVYGYDWPVGSTTANELPLSAIDAKRKQLGVASHMDPTSENPYFHYTLHGTRHVVWYQNQTTVLQRLRLAQKLGLRGLAIWALGEETPAVWSVIEQTWGNKP